MRDLGPADEYGSARLRDPGRPELVRPAFRAAALALVALAPAAIAPGGCGDDNGSANGPPLAWDGTPKLTASPSAARVLIGNAKNDSADVVYIRTPEVRVVDQAGRRIRSSVAFVSGFVRSNYPRNGPLPRRPSRYPQKEQERIGYLAVLDPGESTPVTVSWQEPPGRRAATRIAYKNASLAIPTTPTYAP